jgi:hypothetical protein
MRWTSRCALLGVGALFVASAAVAQNGNSYGSGIKVRKDVPQVVDGQSTTVYVPGTTTTLDYEWNIRFTQFDINAYNAMSEPNIAWHIATADTLRAQLAAIGQSKLTDPRAREFITLAASEEVSGAWADYWRNATGKNSRSQPESHLAKINEIVVDEEVGSAQLSPDPEIERLQQAIQKFTLMPAGGIFDAAFFRFVVEHYQNEYAALGRGRPNAHDDDFEMFIDQTFPLLATRYSQALSILGTLPAN